MSLLSVLNVSHDDLTNEGNILVLAQTHVQYFEDKILIFFIPFCLLSSF